MIGKLRTYTAYVYMKIISDYPWRFINMCRSMGINMWNITDDDGVLFACISKDDFMRLRDICFATYTRVRIVKKKGIRFVIFRYRRHYSFVVGIVIAFCLLFLCSRFVWDISFEGNHRYTDGVLLDFIRGYGAYAGMPLSDLDCSELEVGIRSRYDDITWVSARVSGTKLIIAIKENHVLDAEYSSLDSCDIVSTRTGVVESIVTRKGTPLVKKGDSITQGQILVSGVVKVMDDYGSHISNIYAAADADIYIRSDYEYSDRIAMVHETKTYTGNKKYKRIIGITNSCIEIGWLTGSYAQCDVESEVMPIRLTKSFYLPVYTGMKTYHEYTSTTEKYTKEQANTVLSEHFHKYLKDLSENQVQIIEYDVNIYPEGEDYVMGGTISVIEKAVEYRPVTDIPVKDIEENSSG